MPATNVTIVDQNGDALAIASDGSIATTGGGGGGGAATVADGADVNAGTTTDAAIVTSAAGTISGKLRGIVSLLSGTLTTGGNVASGATDSGNPVKVGGTYVTTQPAVTTGQRRDLALDARGSARVTAPFDMDTNTPARVLAAFDAGGSALAGLLTLNYPEMFNGATYDRGRNNEQATLLASAARTATTTSSDQTNYNGRGVIIVSNVTAESGTTTLTLSVQGKDSISALYYDLITGIVVYNAATDSVNTPRAIILYPGVTTADAIGITGEGTTQKSVLLPRIWRITMTPSDASSQTYSVSSVTSV